MSSDCREGLSAVAGGGMIDHRLARAEPMVLGLRLVREGVSLADSERRFGRSLLGAYGGWVAAPEGMGLLERLPDWVNPAKTWLRLGNQVFAEFLSS